MVYRGYTVLWSGSINSGHWEIFYGSERLGTADDGELNQVIDELEEDG